MNLVHKKESSEYILYAYTFADNIDHIFTGLTRSSAMYPYICIARWIPLTIHPFVPMNNLIYAGLSDVETIEE